MKTFKVQFIGTRIEHHPVILTGDNEEQVRKWCLGVMDEFLPLDLEVTEVFTPVVPMRTKMRVAAFAPFLRRMA